MDENEAKIAARQIVDDCYGGPLIDRIRSTKVKLELYCALGMISRAEYVEKLARLLWMERKELLENYKLGIDDGQGQGGRMGSAQLQDDAGRSGGDDRRAAGAERRTGEGDKRTDRHAEQKD